MSGPTVDAIHYEAVSNAADDALLLLEDQIGENIEVTRENAQVKAENARLRAELKAVRQQRAAYHERATAHTERVEELLEDLGHFVFMGGPEKQAPEYDLRNLDHQAELADRIAFVLATVRHEVIEWA